MGLATPCNPGHAEPPRVSVFDFHARARDELAGRRPRWFYLLAHVEHEYLVLTPGPGSVQRREAWGDSLAPGDAEKIRARFMSLLERCGRLEGLGEEGWRAWGRQGDQFSEFLGCDPGDLVELIGRAEEALRALEAQPETGGAS